MIILIFVPRRIVTGLAHTLLHSVSGITLPPDDAKTPFHRRLAFELSLEELVPIVVFEYAIM